MDQINFFGEEIKVDAKSKKFDYIIQELQKNLINKNSEIERLKDIISTLKNENEELKQKVDKPVLIEVGAFEKNIVNGRRNIDVFVDWIGYSMFIKDDVFNNMEQTKKDIYQEVWNKHIKTMYKEYCEKNKG